MVFELFYVLCDHFGVIWGLLWSYWFGRGPFRLKEFEKLKAHTCMLIGSNREEGVVLGWSAERMPLFDCMELPEQMQVFERMQVCREDAGIGNGARTGVDAGIGVS